MSIASSRSSYINGRPQIIIRDEPPRPVASLPRLRPPRRASVHRAPQEVIDDFWAEFQSKRPGKATSIIPQKAYANKAARRVAAQSASGGQSTAASYASAAAQCRAKVAHIIKECRRVNQKYRDPHFDLELDLQLDRRDCLESLSNVDGIDYGPPSSGGRGRRHPSVAPPPPPPYVVPSFNPQAVKRVNDIFDRPQFFIDGPTANDVRQGRDGDCWLMAALCTMSNKPGLIERVCVAHDAAVGVYGFVFHRDGEWFSEIIDDKLYLTKPDYDESRSERNMLEDRVRVNSEEAYRKIYQSNSGALYFAQCEDPNETWLPLLEKAYAKAHGDYAAIEGGFTGEGIEDLTGGVTSELYTTDILDKEYFWNEELMKVNKTFLFGCSTGVWGKGSGDRGGIVEQHAYSVMRAIEMDGVRLVLLKNPWGRHEWRGAWSDGSKEWTADWIQKLNHRFGDDGSFWISYEDLLRKYQAFDRTRLFGEDWATASIWTTMSVPWTLEYNETKFAFTLTRRGPVVLVLSQLDERYFRGLEGQYLFSLSFRLHKVSAEGESQSDEGDDAYDYIVRSQANYRMSRSVSVEVDLDAGNYLVLVKIDARRDDNILPAEDVIRNNVRLRREKLIRVGLAYDLAHSKGRVIETAAEKKSRRVAAAKKKAREKERLKKQIMEERALDYLAATIRLKKQRKEMAKAKARRQRQNTRRQARIDAEARAADGNSERTAAREGTGVSHRQNSGDINAVVPMGQAPVAGYVSSMSDGSVKPALAVQGTGADTGVTVSMTPAGSPDNYVTPGTVKDAAIVERSDADFRGSGKHTDAAATARGGISARPVHSETDSPLPVNTQAQVDVLPKNPERGNDHLSAIDMRVSLDSKRESQEKEMRNMTRPSSKGSRGVGDNSQEPSIRSRDPSPASRHGGIPRRGRTSRPVSPIHAAVPHGRSATRHPSPPLYIRRSSRTPPSLRMARLYHGGRGDSDTGPRAGRSPLPRSRPVPGGPGDDESDLSSLSSMSDISDTELDFIYNHRRRAVGKHGRGRNGDIPDPDELPRTRPISPGFIPQDRRRSNESLRGDYGIGDPWNAIAVVGLRVYYQEVDGDKERDGGIVHLRVERPHPFTSGQGMDAETVDEDSTSSGDTDDCLTKGDRVVTSEDEGSSVVNRGTNTVVMGEKDTILSGKEKILDVDDSLKDATISISTLCVTPTL